MSRVLCFAYGSNMLPTRVGAPERAPSATWVGAAVLRGHVLTFAKAGADGSGKCHIARSPEPGACVHGVLYDVAIHDLAALDRAEGGYERVPLEVQHGAVAVVAQTYQALADNLDPSRRPFDWYHALVLAGAELGGFPDPYLDALRSHRVIADPDPNRRARHMALIAP